jgi:hypothetical protein
VPPIAGISAIAGVACRTGSSCGVAAMIPRATWRIACAAGESGSEVTSGVPSSECSRKGSDSGT